jgi:hypothetical protein
VPSPCSGPSPISESPRRWLRDSSQGIERNGPKIHFSHGIAKLFATPDKSHFAIVAFADHFELVDKGVRNDEQQLERAEHLIETVRDLVWFGLAPAARVLVPLLRSDLQSLWQEEPLDWDKFKFTDLVHVLQILLESQSPPPLDFALPH